MFAPGGGGSSAPALGQWEQITGGAAPAAVPGDMTPTDLNFSTHGDGVVLFDRTDPANPIAIEAGRYAIQCVVRPADPMSVGKQYEAFLFLDRTGANNYAKHTSAAATTDWPQPFVTISVVEDFPEDGVMTCRVASNTAVGFYIDQCSIVRIK